MSVAPAPRPVAPPEDDGPRQARRRAVERRRRRRLLRRAALLLGALAVIGAVLGAMGEGGRITEVVERAASGGEGSVDAVDRIALLITVSDAGRATSATLLGVGPGATATVLFVPVRTLLEVPGVGLDRLELAAQYGGGELLAAAVDNALGTVTEEVVVVDDDELADLLGAAGPLAVAVPDRLVTRGADSSADVRFEAGEAELVGTELAELWTFVEGGADELASLPRRQRILDALLAAVPVGADVSSAGRALLDPLATAHGAGRLTYDVLPVEPFGGDGGGRSAYRLDEAAAAALVARRLAEKGSAEGTTGVVRVQVLNGVGTPGVGARIDSLLDGGGFRVVLTDNARSFDFDTTQIVVYDETPAALQAARRMRRQLGVGSIRVSRQPQSVVDLTVVVGRDLVADDGS